MKLSKTCSGCKVEKNIDEFGTKKGENGAIYAKCYCRPCSNLRRKQYKDSTEVKRRSKANQLKRNKELRKTLRPAQIIVEDSRAQDRLKGYENDLNKAFVEEMIAKPCAFCCDDTTRMTMDRIDNSLGHLQSNVIQACIRCNLTRGNMPYEAWLMVSKGMREAREAGLFGDWKGR